MALADPRTRPRVNDPALTSPAARERLRRGARAVGRRLRTPAALDMAIATAAVLLIASPLLFTSNSFTPEFTNDLWLASYQQHAIAANLHPTLFLQTEESIFYPFFAFYGGTLFALTGALGVVLGGATVLAYDVMIVAAIAAAYGGLFWLARQLGVKGVMAHAPAIVFVTSAYYISNPYGRSDWTEFMGVSALPLAIAATLRIVRGPWRLAPAACLVGATVVFSGSHNITLMLGTVLTLLALAVYWLCSGLPRRLPWRRMAAAAGLLALGVALNGWFLLPAVIYGHTTFLSAAFNEQGPSEFFDSFGMIFDPLRSVPSESTTPALYVQAPVTALVWGLLALPLAWRERRLRAGILTALIMLAGVLVVIMSPSVYAHLPSLLQEMQFPYRLQSYVTLACAGLVLVGTLALTRRAGRGGARPIDRVFELGLGLALAWGVALAAWQLWVPETHVPNQNNYLARSEALTSSPTVLPASWDRPDFLYADRNLPLVPASVEGRLAPSQVKDDRMTGTAVFPPNHQPFVTNIAGGPYIVHVGGGVHVVGRTSHGYLVLERDKPGNKAVPFELRTQLSAPVILGQIMSVAAAAILLALAVAAVVRRRLRAAGTPPIGEGVP